MIKTCAILGCGWLGLPLAKRLISRGYNLKGSTTQEEKMGELQRNGIRPYQIRLHETGVEGELASMLNSDLLVLNIPPGRRDPNVVESFPAKILQLLDVVDESPLKHILFIGSTSVYNGSEGRISEDSPLTAVEGSGKALIAAEQLLGDARPTLTILRFGGLVGGDRHPGRFLAGKTDVSNPGHPVNLIHRDDCVEMIYQIIKQEKWESVYNASADKHPSRSAFYTRAAVGMGLRPPVFSSVNEGEGRWIDNTKIKTELNYTLKYPDPDKFVSFADDT